MDTYKRRFTHVHHKLVRDNVIDYISAEGMKPEWHTANKKEYKCELRRKLFEEINEFDTSGDPEKLADVLEAIKAISEALGISWKKLLAMRRRKYKQKEAFEIARLETDNEDYEGSLGLILREKFYEFKESDNPDALVDLLELIKALTETLEVSWRKLLAMRVKKCREKGGFEKKIILERVIEVREE